MLHDAKRERRERRRLNAVKRVEQIDMLIAELDGSAPCSAGWCRERFVQFVLVNSSPSPDVITLELLEKHCIVGAVQKHVPAPRTRFYELLAPDLPWRYYRKIKKREVSASSALIDFNDDQETVQPVLKLLRVARAHQAKLAGLIEVTEHAL
jgi:hypothetical protein